jgi:Peptidase M76 family
LILCAALLCKAAKMHISAVSEIAPYVQIRAASLSGDCTFRQEVLRGNNGIRRQHQVQQCDRAECGLQLVT